MKEGERRENESEGPLLVARASTTHRDGLLYAPVCAPREFSACIAMHKRLELYDNHGTNIRVVLELYVESAEATRTRRVESRIVASGASSIGTMTSRTRASIFLTKLWQGLWLGLATRSRLLPRRRPPLCLLPLFSSSSDATCLDSPQLDSLGRGSVFVLLIQAHIFWLAERSAPSVGRGRREASSEKTLQSSFK